MRLNEFIINAISCFVPICTCFLAHRHRQNQTWALVVVMDHNRIFDYELRVCSANGFLLSHVTIPASCIDAMFELLFYRGGWTVKCLYHGRIAEFPVNGYQYGRECTEETLAMFLSKTQE